MSDPQGLAARGLDGILNPEPGWGWLTREQIERLRAFPADPLVYQLEVALRHCDTREQVQDVLVSAVAALVEARVSALNLAIQALSGRLPPTIIVTSEAEKERIEREFAVRRAFNPYSRDV